jgi:hypothetical protein
MPNKTYNVIHIFKNSVQLIGKDTNRLFQGHDLSALAPVINQIASALEVEDPTDFHVIHLFIGSRAMFLSGKKDKPNRGNGFEALMNKSNVILKWEDVDAALVDALIEELEAVPLPEAPAESE